MMGAKAAVSSRRRGVSGVAGRLEFPITSAMKGMAQGTDRFGGTNIDALNQDWAGMVALGVKIVRFDMYWDRIQPTNSTTFDWAYDDKIVNGIVANGMMPLPIFHGCPAWARPSADISVPANMSQFATFCAACVTRYKDRVKYWEVWNEQNARGFWPPDPDPVRYTQMLQAVYPAVKAVDPTAYIITGGTASVPDNTGLAGGNMGEREFISAVYANGGKNYFDAMGIHPYSYPLLCSDTQNWNGWSMMNATATSVRSIMTANGDSAKPIWATEYGGPTGTDTNARSEAWQINYVNESHNLGASLPWLGPIVWYQYWDKGANLADQEDNFGLLRNADYSPKPAFDAYLKLTYPAQASGFLNFQQGAVNNGVTYTGAVDTMLQQAAPTANNSTAVTLNLSNANSPNNSQALLRFDNIFGSGAGQIPAGAKIISAFVHLTVTAGGHMPSFHRMLQTWSATDTWNSRTGGISRDGVEAENTPLAPDSYQNPGTFRFVATPHLKLWQAGTPNYGWLIENMRELVLSFASSDNATLANRPKLIVTYVV